MRLIDADELIVMEYGGIKFVPKEFIDDAPTIEEHEGHWIPCTEQLPETEDKVLCCTQTKKGTANIVLGYYASGRWCCGMNSNVTAWMPLPEPYEEDKQCKH